MNEYANNDESTGENSILPLPKLIGQAGYAGYFLMFGDIVSALIKRRRSFDDYGEVDGAAFIQIAYVMLVFIFIFVVLTREKNKQLFKTIFSSPLKYFFIYTCLAGLSVLWSSNFKISGFRAFECMVYLLLITAVINNLKQNCSVQHMIEWVVMWSVWMIFWSWVGVLKMGGFGALVYSFQAARLSSPIFLFIAIFLSRRKLFKLIIAAFALLSFSNKVYFGIAGGILGFIRGSIKAQILFMIIGAVIGGIVLKHGWEVLLQDTLFHGRDSVSLDEMSGRWKMWKYCWSAIKEHPLFGYGFVSGEIDVLSGLMGAISIHNGFLSAQLGTGIMGLFLFIMFFVKSFFAALDKSIPSKLRPALIATIIMVVVIAGSSPGLGTRVFGGWRASILAITLVIGIQGKFRNRVNKKHKKRKKLNY
jgi:O-antigen ligase